MHIKARRDVSLGGLWFPISVGLAGSSIYSSISGSILKSCIAALTAFDSIRECRTHACLPARNNKPQFQSEEPEPNANLNDGGLRLYDVRVPVLVPVPVCVCVCTATGICRFAGGTIGRLQTGNWECRPSVVQSTGILPKSRRCPYPVRGGGRECACNGLLGTSVSKQCTH